MAAAGAVAFVFLIVVMARQGLQRAGAWAGPLAALAAIVAAVAGVWPLVSRRPEVTVPPEPEVAMPPRVQVPEWVVDRPTELAAVVSALVDAAGGMVGITTGLFGAGGFGKTTLARMVCADPLVRQRFSGRVYFVTVGRDVRSAAAIAAKINDVIKLMTGENVTFTSPEQAGYRLGMLLDSGPPTLLVLDDLWESQQLEPFTSGGRKCARLITTRIPELLVGRGVTVRVDQMSPEQAQRLLTDKLPPLDRVMTEKLLAVTGRWPLLLRLVNKILLRAAQTGANLPEAAAALLERLRTGGPQVVDNVLGEATKTLNVNEPQQRERAVRATIEASTELLASNDVDRFTELSVFAEDETIPLALIARLWGATAGLDILQVSQVCARLAGLALVSPTGSPVANSSGVVLHDVVRDFLRGELPPEARSRLHGVLCDAVAAELPTASPLDRIDPNLVQAAWWELGIGDRYMWDHLIEHMLEAPRQNEAEATAGDLRWVGARLKQFGPAAPFRDLSLVGTARAIDLAIMLSRAAHLLAPTEPAEAVVDVLYSRIDDHPDWGPQARALLKPSCPSFEP